ncbi:MAG: GIY-YIG nuclease family protein [Eubacteriales bacterium]|nr:GIY-YIG nuclease family protein [Eubacteriales bacterium]
MCFVYILKCADNSLYTGWTNNLDKRLDKHSAGDGAKYTRGRLPVELVYYEAYDTKEEAMSRESRIKRMSRSQKIELTKKSSVNP